MCLFVPRFVSYIDWGKESWFYAIFVVSVRKSVLFLWVVKIGCVTLLWHSLGLPYNYFVPVNAKYNI